VGFAAGRVLDEGEEVKAREDRIGEKMGREFYMLRRGEVSAMVEVRQIDGPKEGVRRDNRVEKKIDAGKRSDVGGQEERLIQGDHLRLCRVRGGQRQR
jgi:hypothetical protein